MKKRIVMVDGVPFRDFQRPKAPLGEHLRQIKAMPLREGDVIIAAFPKCGESV
jgi:hypothetical protein